MGPGLLAFLQEGQYWYDKCDSPGQVLLAWYCCSPHARDSVISGPDVITFSQKVQSTAIRNFSK